jgi:16S rRNA A1518/A1519 N6-dimethyltransferase RsmA/KsgA/DIM1 with predicted DNA glycosylase/AP lyase activity
MGGVAGFSQDIGIDQVFMHDEKTLEGMVDLAGIRKSDSILEIGTGTGNLTKKLAERAKRVITIEIDERLRPVLRKQLRNFRNVRIIWGNALEVIEKGDVKFNKIVSNPPYSISEPLIGLLFRIKFEYAVLTMPWGFIERLTANPEDGKYSKLSIFSQAFFRIETMMKVPDSAWTPRPDTPSVVIKLTRKKAGGIGDIVLREIALQSDKKLKNAVREVIVRHARGNGTKRKARNTLVHAGLSSKLLEKKISEMNLDEIKVVIHKMGELFR